MRINRLLGFMVLLLLSCKSNDTQYATLNDNNYTVLSEEVLNIPEKAQISTYVLYNDSVYEKPILEKIALEVYNKSKRTRLKDKSLAKIFLVYIYSNKDDYAINKNKAITMLYKGINNKEPEIAYSMPVKQIPPAYSETKPIDESTSPTSNNAIQMANEQYFSSWDGSNPEFVEAIKKSMDDPESFDHVETRYSDKGSYLRILMIYRGKNAYNATIKQTSTCNFDKLTETVSDVN